MLLTIAAIRFRIGNHYDISIKKSFEMYSNDKQVLRKPFYSYFGSVQKIIMKESDENFLILNLNCFKYSLRGFF